MIYNETVPSPREASVIDLFWTNRFEEGDLREEYDLIVPDGCLDAVFVLSGNYKRKSVRSDLVQVVDQCHLIGPFKECHKVYQPIHTRVFGIRFNPETIFQVLGYSLSDLRGTVIPLYELFPDLSEQIMEGIYPGISLDELVAITYRWLSKQNFQITPDPYVDLFKKFVLKNRGCMAVSDFCTRYNVHKSTLELRFSRAVGLLPKEYARIIRFDWLVYKLTAGNRPTLSELAYELDFYDHSHMTREFNNFAEMSPSHFLKRQFNVPRLAAFSLSGKH